MSSNQLRLYRIAESDLQTLGRFRIGDYSCCALELPWRNNKVGVSRIMPGRYKTSYQVSPNFGPSIRVHDVPGRTNIVIHVLNFIGSVNPATGVPDSRGCPGPGLKFKDIDGDGILDVTDSRIAMNQIIERHGKGDGFLIVSDKFLQPLKRQEFREIADVEGFLL